MLHSYVTIFVYLTLFLVFFFFFFCVFIPSFVNVSQIHHGCSRVNVWQPRHARTKMDPIHKSLAGPGSWQNLGLRLARIAKTTGLIAVLVSCLFALVYEITSSFFVLLCTNTHSMFLHTRVAAKTCGNKDGFNSRVKCGSGFLTKSSSTRCTHCKNDGTECCIRMLLIRAYSFNVLVVAGAFLCFCTFIWCLVHAIQMHTLKCLLVKTCANKDGFNSRVKCGSGFLAKAGSTRCTHCKNDGTDCCIRMLLIRTYYYVSVVL